MNRSIFFLSLFMLSIGFVVSSCDGNEVDLTNFEPVIPAIEVEAGNIRYTQDGVITVDTALGFVCRFDNDNTPGRLGHAYYATNIDNSNLSDTNLLVPIAEGDVIITGYAEDVTNIRGLFINLLVDIGGGELSLASCYGCPVTFIENDNTLTGTFSGTVVSTNPDSSFTITDGSFEVPLIDLGCE